MPILPYNRARPVAAFTMVELLVSMTLILGLMMLLLGTVDQTQQLWVRSSSKAAQFQTARHSFEIMARRLGQATLNTYWRPHDPSLTNSRADFQFRRQAELQFISGPTSKIFTSPTIGGLNSNPVLSYPFHSVFFQAPLGQTEEINDGGDDRLRFASLSEMLTACGYFVEYGEDPNRPDFLPKDRVPPQVAFRLMELTVAGERLTIFQRPNDNKSNVEPMILDEQSRPYMGLVDMVGTPETAWMRPRWMKEALRREQGVGKSRFYYGRVMAEHVIGLVILPKLPPQDRVNKESLDLAPHYQYDSWRILRGDTGLADPVTGARDNLLPPIVQIMMIAIDGPSAARLDAKVDKPPAWSEGLFQKVEDEGQLQEDMALLEKALKEDPARLNYRIFTTDVVLRGSKWSRDP